uniref:threonine synthase-like 2 isoform X2 n=1 Tax=Myodes glareolus TaxID=447135 RepID=UPI002020797E|nr:threonine synthase-like 2 isoform X2 [Myodes glareolus]
MWYTSTRGVAPRVNFEGALFSGYAPDGGLYVPEELPQLDRETLCRWSTLSYRSLVKELCALFIGLELIPRHDLNDLIDQAFSRFRHRDVVHLCRLKNGLNVLELWHGATYAFKDLSLSCTAQFLQYFLQKRKKHVTIVVGTSGDTGSASIESVQGCKNMDIIVLLPKGRCTKIQELQMTTVLKENVHVFGVEGNSDELDEPIKAVFADVPFVQRHNLMSLNSINWSRVLVQMAHHFFAYFQCAPSLDTHPLPPVEVVVPTGAGGNLAAGCIAQKMGLPIRLVVAVNSNDIIHRTVQKGDFSLCEVVKPTLASAMDIQLSEAVTSGSVSDEAITQTMGRCWEENQYLLCPHSATAVNYHYQQTNNRQSSNISRCCLAPASAAKFPEAVKAAGLTPQTPAEILALEHKETRCIPMRRGDDWIQMLRNTIEGLSQRWEGCAVNPSE